MEFTQAEIEMKSLNKVAKKFLKWMKHENTKMGLFLNILDQKPWIDSVLNGACDPVWPEEVKTRSNSNSRINLSILIKALIGMKSFGFFL